MILFILLLLFGNAQAATTGELTVAVPGIQGEAPSAQFFSVIHSAVSSINKANGAPRVTVITESALASDYAAIVLHSYRIKNLQIESRVVPPVRVRENPPPQGKGGQPAAVQRWPRGFTIAIVVLGTAPLDDTTPSLDMVRRVEQGMRLLRKAPQAVLIVSGGRTAGPISEAKMMALIAYARGASPSRVILEEDSRSTAENARFVAPIFDRLGIKRAIIVSRPTHLKRAMPLFRKYTHCTHLCAAGSRISREEIAENFRGYLAFNDSPRVRQMLDKIMKEFPKEFPGFSPAEKESVFSVLPDAIESEGKR